MANSITPCTQEHTYDVWVASGDDYRTVYAGDSQAEAIATLASLPWSVEGDVDVYHVTTGTLCLISRNAINTHILKGEYSAPDFEKNCAILI